VRRHPLPRQRLASDGRDLPLHHVPARQRRAGGRLGHVSGSAGRVPEGSPTTYASSPEARRGFCPTCGTQICFTAEDIPGLIDLTIGSLDHPELVAPTLHYWAAERLPWVRFADDLPKFPEFPPVE
jgi:hypothetical protein